MKTPEQRRIVRVICFTNRMLMVFDQYGQQMPEYQGRYKDVWEKIGRAAPHIFWEFLDWRRDVMPYET